MPLGSAALGRLALPVAIAASAWILARYFLAPGVDVEAMTRGIAGPTTWPKVMLYCVAACAVLLFCLRLREVLGGGAGALANLPGGVGGATHHERKALAGIALVVLYGLALPGIGFALSTTLFIAAWLLLGGVRKPAVIGLTSVVGTAALLYLFVKVSLLPLDRGKGVFEQATVAIYRLLGIY
jgi:putative tricarboxylic transport membrane protein